VKALSIKQPWAWLICAGYKDVENRSWTTNFRGRIYVHAGLKFDREGDDELRGMIRHRFPALYANKVDLDYYFGIETDGPRGEIIGEVDITGCVAESSSPWFVGPYGFVLENPVLYKQPIPCKGRLGLFEVDAKVIQK